MSHPRRHLLALLCIVALGAACGGDEAASGGPAPYNPQPPGVPNQGRGFGQLRAIISAGEVPQPGVLSLDVFLDEHALPRSQRPCAAPVCLYAARGLGPDLRTGIPRGWIALSLRPGPQRPPARPDKLIIAVDTSSSMAGPPMDALRRALYPLPGRIGQGRLQLIRFGEVAKIEQTVGGAESATWSAQVDGLLASGPSNLQAGLRAALVTAMEDTAQPARVLFIADGTSNVGITNAQRLLTLADSYGAAGVELSTLGLGNDFPSQLLHSLQQSSLGTFHHIEDLDTLDGALLRELGTQRIRLAEAITMTAALGQTRLAATYGADHVSPEPDGLTISLNAAGVDRRDGQERPHIASGANVLLIELEPGRPSGDGAVRINLDYIGFDGKSYTEDITLPAASDWERAVMRGAWDDASVERFAVVMSVHDALKAALEDYARGDAQQAARGLKRFITRLEDWLRDRDEQDIYQDLLLLRQLLDTIRLRTGSLE